MNTTGDKYANSVWIQLW